MAQAGKQKFLWGVLVVLFAGALMVVTCKRPQNGPMDPTPPAPPAGWVPLKVGKADIFVEVAATPAEREQGLMNRDSLGWNRGMLFVFPEEEPMSFWMKNTLIPLSIAFAGTDGVITQITDMKPLTENTHRSSKPGRFALEMNQGWFQDRGVQVGDRIEGLPGREPPAEEKD